ncbi:MAG: ABC transporter substrate-binding protein, partial [bacterium]
MKRFQSKMTGLAVCLAVAFAFTLVPGKAKADELRIGFLTPLTGFFAQVGKDMLNGFQMYLDEQGGTLAGAKIKFIVEDNLGKAGVSVRKATKLIRRDRVHMFIGGLLASTGYALAPVSTRHKVIYIAPISAADDLTQRQKKKYPFFIRTGWTSSQPSHPFGKWACEQGYKRIATIGADYAFGHEVIGGFQKSFEDCGGKIVQKIWPKIGTIDFGPFIPLIKRDVDAVFTLMVGGMSLALPKQFKAAGLTMPLLGGGTSADEFILPSMGDEAIGYVTSLQYSA